MSLSDLLVRGARWEVASLGPDCTDEATFHVRSASRGLGLTCEHATMPEGKRELSFAARALREAGEVLTIEQGNYVASEVLREPLKPGRELVRCTPPFLLSRAMAERAHAREDIELEFVAYLERPLLFRFDRPSRTMLRVDGRRRNVSTLRFLGVEDDEADENIGVLELDASSSTLLRLSRDEDTFGVELRAIRSA